MDYKVRRAKCCDCDVEFNTIDSQDNQCYKCWKEWHDENYPDCYDCHDDLFGETEHDGDPNYFRSNNHLSN